jgi:hypothetical protein
MSQSKQKKSWLVQNFGNPGYFWQPGAKQLTLSKNLTTFSFCFASKSGNFCVNFPKEKLFVQFPWFCFVFCHQL